MRFFITALTFLSLLGCQDNSNLVRVAIPEPESATLEATSSSPKDFKAEGKFQLIEVPYDFNAFENSIDARTMEIHFSKHYLGFANKLNTIIAAQKKENLSITQLLAVVDDVDPDLKNNVGGYYNHHLFFEGLSKDRNQKPSEELMQAFTTDFGSYDNFETEFKKSANTFFGSGWVWLIVTPEGKLVITTTQNQNTPLMFDAAVKGKPILVLDLWEHAYYLKYQNNRKKYVDAFFDIINWKKVSERYSKIKSINPPPM
jgi:Fe-Mn family superoxide dismutase